ncbi:MAG: hypothetical protein ACRCTG_15455 [Aestuariivirga sp.]
MADPVTLGILTLTMTAGSTLMQAQGQSAGAKAQQIKSQKAAQIARVQADQADTAYRDELRTTLANIDTIRASANVSADSPTAFAIRDKAGGDSDLQRERKVAGLKMQANQYEQDAAFYGSAARNYMSAGLVTAGAQMTGGTRTLGMQSGWF